MAKINKQTDVRGWAEPEYFSTFFSYVATF